MITEKALLQFSTRTSTEIPVSRRNFFTSLCTAFCEPIPLSMTQKLSGPDQGALSNTGSALAGFTNSAAAATSAAREPRREHPLNLLITFFILRAS